MKIGVFTIAAKNYLAYVRVLMNSIARVHPEYERFLCLTDTVDGCFDDSEEPFRVIEAATIGVPTFADMALRYDVMEFSTALKPSMIRWLLQNTELDLIIYLDPDIAAYSRFDAIERAFSAGASVALTPHITAPLEDGCEPNDHHILQSGVFNLGFVAVRRGQEAAAFLAWWARRLATQAEANFSANLFTDQRWCDLAPCFLDRLAIIKDPGYNVAYWNLKERHLDQDTQGAWLANGQPLAFFHFSGVRANNPQLLSRHQNRYTWENLPQLRPLFDAYRSELLAHGAAVVGRWPYAYDTLCGTSVFLHMRLLYRETHAQPSTWEGQALHDHLVALCSEAADLPDFPSAPQITRLMHRIHQSRPDLLLTFNLMTPEGQTSFDGWFRSSAAAEYPLAEVLLPLARAPAPVPQAAPALVPPVAADDHAGVSQARELLRPLWRSLDATQRETLAPLALALLRKRVATRQGRT